MSEPTVRLYGLMPMTRPRYVFQLVVAFGLAAGILGLWWARWPLLREQLQGFDAPSIERAVWVGDAIPWAILAVAAIQVVEALIVLRLFARKGTDGGTSVSPGEASPGSSRGA